MACTGQSALNYVKNGRILLVGRLQNLSVIVENLQQCKILNDEEVSDIKSTTGDYEKTRTILDLVTRKGEKACYEFLKILDATRKRTFPKLPSFLSSQQQGLPAPQHTRDPDLHQWISCFPFKDDQRDYSAGSGPCHRYQRELKLKAEKTVNDAWTQAKRITKDSSKWETFPYTPLVLDTNVNEISKIKCAKYKKSRRKKLNMYIPTDKRRLSPEDLLHTHEKKILLVGKPGIGKTTIAQRILSLWAERQGPDLSYMFYFDEKTVSPVSLESLLFDTYLKPSERNGSKEVLQDIEENSENTVIIFDGISNVTRNSVVQNILEKNLLPDAKIIITCRPEDVSEDFLSDWSSYRLEVLGFSQESIRAYFKNWVSTDSDTVYSVLNNLELFSLCHVPMYAFIVAACISFGPCETRDLMTTTKIYLHIFRLCMKKHGDKSVQHLDKYIQDKKKDVLSLAEMSYNAMLQKSVRIPGPDGQEHSVQHAFLRSIMMKDSPSSAQIDCAFLHNTMQEFWTALWLLEKPDKISETLQRCQTEEGKYLKNIFPFLCGFLSEENTRFVKCVVSEDQVKRLSEQAPLDIINAFIHHGPPHESEQVEENLLFVCQCLYESQSEKACSHFLMKVSYHLDLSEESLDPHQCCAVSYVINQAGDSPVQLDLENSTVSDPGLKLILGCVEKLQNIRLTPSLHHQLWSTALCCGQQCDLTRLLRVCGNEIHLSVQADRAVCERAGEVMKQSPESIKLCLHWDQFIQTHTDAIGETICQCLPHISTISFSPPKDQKRTEEWNRRVYSFQLDLCMQGALYETRTGEKTVMTLLSVLRLDSPELQSGFMLDLYSHVKDYETQTGRRVLSALQPVYQSAPAVWDIDLSQRKVSLFLEVLKFQNVKKPVKLRDWSDEESEVGSFLQCLPYISELM